MEASPLPGHLWILVRLLAVAAAAALTTGLSLSVVASTASAGAAPAETVTVRAASASSTSTTLRKAAAGLPLATEVRTGYSRSAFRLWTDADHDGCNTREEVLLGESRGTVHKDSACTISSGTWVSYYDRRTWTSPGSLDIDHVVPLAEAWDSGARRWTAGTRERYANDLTDGRTLVAVTASVNRSKGDQDPAEWLPAHGTCRYVREWVAVKLRWRLTVDAAEKRALTSRASACPDATLAVTRATVDTTVSSPAPGTGPARITRVVYDPAGSDTTANANDERVVIQNTGPGTLSLGGWTLRDASTHRYTFPAMSLAAGTAVTVHSGRGSNTADHVYAGWSHVWNNTGDTATLGDAAGSTVDRCSWSGGEGSTDC